MSRRRHAPSVRWSSEHGRKLWHPSRRVAQQHADEINALPSHAGEVPREPYPCRWGQQYRDGETALEHWHIGRRPDLTS